jgi:hypothetical protein
MFEVNVWWFEGSDYKCYEFTGQDAAREYIASVPVALGLDWTLWWVDSCSILCLDGS